MSRYFAACAAAAAIAFAGVANAQTWTLDGAASHLAYGSIKKDKIGEVNSFSGLSGTVDETGKANVTIDLTTIETNIDIRNERMLEHVFKGVGKAQLSAQLDMDEVKGLAVGDMAVVDVEGALSLLGVSTELDLEMVVVRLAEDKVMAMSNDMVFVGTEELGVTAGIDRLMELAKLPGITRTSPVTLCLVFTSDMKKAEATPAAATTTQVAAVTGDVKAGKKTADEILQDFVETFEAHRATASNDGISKKGDGKVTLNEFIDYYSNVSASIDNDEYFQLMIVNAWNLNNVNYGKGWGGDL